MIHSLSGGVIKSADKHTFIKVQVENLDQSVWLVCDDFSVNEGDIAVYEDKNGWLKRGKVVKVDRGVSGQTPPVPMNRIGVALKIEQI